MRLSGRIGIFVAPVILTALCRVALATASKEELPLYQNNHAKIVDLSVDLVLAAAAILLGVLLYVPSGGHLQKPGGSVRDVVSQRDLVICAAVIVTALVLLFFFVLAVPPIFGYEEDRYHVLHIWLPDVIGLAALISVVVRLT